MFPEEYRKQVHDRVLELPAKYGRVAVQLLDLVIGASIYRVFLLPGSRQFDLSFTPASEFGAGSPKFKLLCVVTVLRLPDGVACPSLDN